MPQATFANAALHSPGVELSDLQLAPRVGFRDPLISAIGNSIFEVLHEDSPLNQLYLESLLLTLAVHLVRNNGDRSVRMDGHKRGLSPAALRDVVDYIEANLDRELSLAEIAAEARYSPFHLSRCFHATTGKPIHQFVLECRVERAKHILESTDLPLAEVALRTGFTSHSQFTAHFRRRYRTTPSDYRRQLLGAAHLQQESAKE